jgi:hypothetical protein
MNDDEDRRREIMGQLAQQGSQHFHSAVRATDHYHVS